jgi:hypothetical protein
MKSPHSMQNAAHLAGAHIDEEAGSEGVEDHLRPGIDAREDAADGDANRCSDRKRQQEEPRLPVLECTKEG